MTRSSLSLAIATLVLLAALLAPTFDRLPMSAPATTEAWHGKQSPKQVTVWESLRPERTGYVYYQWCDTEGLDRFWIILGLDDWDDTWGNNLTPYRIDAAGCVENFEWYPTVEPWWPGHYLNDVCVADAYLGYGFTRCQ